MERLIDRLLVSACCLGAVALAAWGGFYADAPGVPAIACFLLSVIAMAASELLPTGMRTLPPLAYCAACAVVPEGLFFLPLAVYELMRCVYEPWPARGAVMGSAVPVVRWLQAGIDGRLLLLIMLLCACAAMLSARTSALAAQRALAHRSYDDLRARALGERARGGSCLSVQLGDDSAAEGVESGDGVVFEGAQLSEAASAAPARPLAFANLTEREYEVVRLVAEGLDNHEIAAAAFISEGTVRNRISSVLQKTGLKNRTQLAVTWWQANAR